MTWRTKHVTKEELPILLNSASVVPSTVRITAMPDGTILVLWQQQTGGNG